MPAEPTDVGGTRDLLGALRAGPHERFYRPGPLATKTFAVPPGFPVPPSFIASQSLIQLYN
jgi:hypothetical protein